MNLRELLGKWRSHNEVYAKPADAHLYELFKEIIEKLESYEKSHPEEPAPPSTPPVKTADDTTDGPGQNHPTDPSGNP